MLYQPHSQSADIGKPECMILQFSALSYTGDESVTTNYADTMKLALQRKKDRL